jgi:hypothetical protein
MTDSAMDRRRFHRTVGAVAAAPLVVALAGPSCAEDADASGPTPKAAAAPPSTTPPSTAPLNDAPLNDVEHYLALIALIDPERLRDEHLAALREDVAANLASSRKLSAFALTNADEPAPVFAAWRAEG